MFGLDFIDELRAANQAYADLLGVINERLDKVNSNLERLIEIEEENLEHLKKLTKEDE